MNCFISTFRRRALGTALAFATVAIAPAAMADDIFASGPLAGFGIGEMFDLGATRGVSATGMIWGQQDTGKTDALPQPDLVVVGNSCAQSDLDGLLGHHVSAADVLHSHMPVRIFTPTNQIGTMDYLPNRLNLQVDAQDVIFQLSCG